ncbi:MAG: dihydroorotase family protein [Candidatus Methanomethylicia archaeon]
MIADLVISGGKVWHAGEFVECAIVIDNGKIVKLCKEPLAPRSDLRLNVNGLLILPGLIDIHSHLRDFKLSYKEDFYTGTCAAASGGFTTVFDMPNTEPVTNSPIRLREKIEKIHLNAIVNVGLYSAPPKNIEEFIESVNMGIAGFKVYLSEYGELNTDHCNYNFYNACNNYNIRVHFHAELRDFININTTTCELNVLNHHLIRPTKAEIEAINYVFNLKSIYKFKAHICHISSSDSCFLISKVKYNHLNISVEVTPHHLILNNNFTSTWGNIAKVNPPLRTEYDRKMLVKLLNEGLVDCIVTDHSPHALEEKSKDYCEAPSGFPNFEVALPVLLSRCLNDELIFSHVISAMSENPAKLLNLKNKGKIEPGFDADLVIVNHKGEYTIDPEKFKSKARYSPFKNMKVKFKVFKTILGGLLIYDEDEILVKKGCGKFVKIGVKNDSFSKTY